MRLRGEKEQPETKHSCSQAGKFRERQAGAGAARAEAGPGPTGKGAGSAPCGGKEFLGRQGRDGEEA